MFIKVLLVVSFIYRVTPSVVCVHHTRSRCVLNDINRSGSSCGRFGWNVVASRHKRRHGLFLPKACLAILDGSFHWRGLVVVLLRLVDTIGRRVAATRGAAKTHTSSTRAFMVELMVLLLESVDVIVMTMCLAFHGSHDDGQPFPSRFG